LLFRHDWIVYARPPFGGLEHALRYLSGYTHRVAISNRRLVALQQGSVMFRWRDSVHANQQGLLTLPIDEFLRRFLLHLLPRGFMRIRNFGFLANRQRAMLLPLCFHSLQDATEISTCSGPVSLTLELPCLRRNHACHRTPLCSSTSASFTASPAIHCMNQQPKPRIILVLRRVQNLCASSGPESPASLLSDRLKVYDLALQVPRTAANSNFANHQDLLKYLQTP
jgi:hypothetical protein